MNRLNFKDCLQHKILPLVIAGVVGLLPALVGIHPSQVIGESMALHCATKASTLLCPYGNPKEAIL